MRMRLLVATRNAGKVREFQRLLSGLDGVELLAMSDYEHVPEVVEDADTFEGNAVKKACEVAKAVGLPTLADDSGLVVDALGGAPGVLSARYGGEHGDDEANNRKLLGELAEVPDEQRTTRFACALAFADPDGALGARAHVEHGAIEGRILRERRGEGGFGYDPLFVPIGETRTTAEMPADEKNAISHRAEASRKMREFLRGYLDGREA